MLALALCAAYALGCLSPGWWLVRLVTGSDLRITGSGRTGATNAARVLGHGGFALVLLLDAAKAAAAVLVARLLVPGDPWSALAMPAAVAGHIWPAPLRFKGGRGAGPLLGGCIMLNPFFALAAAVPAGIAGAITRRRFVATLAAALGGIAAAWWLLPLTPDRIAFAIALALVVLAHRSYFVRASHRPVP
jgi:acyl phosphate:glycerol-3-phosphate acyltransferase